MKHSNNGDSCFSLFEKIHFVLLSAPSSSPRPALNSSRCLLLLGLIREREREKTGGREKGRRRGREEKSPGHNELYVEECGKNITVVQLIPGLYQLQSGSTQR